MGERLTQTDFARRLRELTDTMAPGARKIIALAGPPGSGKSTIADCLADELSSRLGEDRSPVAVLPMDGYHFDDELLKALGRYSRKGAPDTFDVGGLKAMLHRLAAHDEDTVVVPRFDRDIEIARAGARMIHRDVQVVLVEGNYLLLNAPPWDELQNDFDLTVMIEVDEEVLRQRLTERWVSLGLDEDAVRAKLDDNDLPNGRLVYRGSRPADITLID